MDEINVNETSQTSNIKSETVGFVNVEKSVEEVKEKEGWITEAINREATPKAERKETVDEFTKRYGIDRSTYYYQMRKKENKAQVVGIWLNEALNGGNEVLDKLKQNALEGKEKSIEMYLKFVLELAENLDIKSNGKDLFPDNSKLDKVNKSIETFLNGNNRNITE